MAGDQQLLQGSSSQAYEGPGEAKKGPQGGLAAAEPYPAAAPSLTQMTQIIKTENHILLVLNELCHQLLGGAQS